MTSDVVIGLDSSTQSTKAVAWTRTGEAIAEGRAPIPMSTPAPGRVEQDPADWRAAAAKALSEVASTIDPNRIAGIAISNQRETVAFVDGRGDKVAPGVVWLDERAASEIEPFSKSFGADRLHRITGKPPDVTPVVYRLSWFRRNQPDVLDRAARILDVHGVLSGWLTGRATASWTSADPFGVFDIAEKRWSEEVLGALDLTAEKFAALARPGAPIGGVTTSAAAATGLREGTPIFAAGGDGQCAGLGVDGARPGVVYLNLGTALITGAWSEKPLVGRFWRTMTSPTGEGYFLEGCQRAGTFLLDWFVETFLGGGDPATAHRALTDDAAKVPLGSDGVTISPYLTGCMDPHWNAGARASVSSLGPQHGRAHVYRAALEALTLESARCVAAMADAGMPVERIVAVGGGANNRLWAQMFADATGAPLAVSDSVEASALGAGISAAVGAGWFAGFEDAAAAMSRTGAVFTPNPAARGDWEALSKRQAATYRPD